MNTKHFLLSLCCIAALAACNSQPKEYTLSGKFENCGAAEALVKIGDNQFDTIAIAEDGTFSYSKALEHPQLSFIMAANKGFYQLILINGTATRLEADLNVPGDCRFTGDLEKDAAAMNRQIEEIVLSAPSQYAWSYKRYKAPRAARKKLEGVTKK